MNGRALQYRPLNYYSTFKFSNILRHVREILSRMYHDVLGRGERSKNDEQAKNLRKNTLVGLAFDLSELEELVAS